MTIMGLLAAVAEAKIRNPFLPQLPKIFAPAPADQKKPTPTIQQPNPPPVQMREPPQPSLQLTPQVIQPPKLTVSGLVWHTDRPQAIINGDVVGIGDTVAEAQVVAIKKAGVTVLYKGETFTFITTKE